MHLDYFPGGKLGWLALLALMFVVAGIQRFLARRAARARIGRDWDSDTHVDRVGRPYAGRERRDPADPEQDQSYRVDDQTWFDLDLDAVVARLDYTQTGIGAQTLYRALRRPALTPELGRRRVALADAISADPRGRADCQRVLAEFRNRGWVLPWILWGPRLLPPIPVWAMRVLGVTPLLLGPAAYFNESMALVVLTIVNLAANVGLHALTSHRHRTEMSAAAELGEMLSLATDLRAQTLVRPAFKQHERGLSRIQRVFGRRGRGLNARLLAARASLVDLTDYPSAFFMIKVTALYAGLGRIERTRPQLCELFDTIGEIDLCIGLAKLRHLRGLTPAQLGERDDVALRGATHPLIDECVPNDLDLSAHGLVLTGSNMAGKSTFLRTLGLNAILAQSLGVGYFDSYEAPILRVYSSMSIIDDLLAGRSRYRAEAERILALTRAGTGGACLFLIDEMFAGTNPIERTAAAHAVARYLSETHIVLLATHDLDLVGSLIADGFAAAYFSETAYGDDLRFDYQLRIGRAGRPNAISILRTLEFPEAISADAERFAGVMSRAAPEPDPDPTTNSARLTRGG
ncbi:MutS-related protein [Enhygromyxa salina]|uniref:DNA mismatch repair protein MutS n=1 Tax=Enhygromyxa salina TaxID=215803 RepID=A0A2S9YQ40_9BACT|nr:hypothetical protein [Enhygromyxa salina]PRQ07214.1 DNA mismatch repair protein MutS [Enhygromyxa salina]